jgi:hypothetical protein
MLPCAPWAGVLTMASAANLPAVWRQRAKDLRDYGALPAAVAWERAAQELESELLSEENEELTLGQAVLESGYSERALRQKIATGDIPNAGERGRPRIRRRDLPHRPARRRDVAYDPEADAASLLARIR